MNRTDTIFVAGHNGLVGSAIVRALQKQGFQNILMRTRQELDLLDQTQVKEFFETEKPAYVFMAAAKVGGILANKTKPAEFIFQNLTIQNNIIHSAYLSKVKKLLFLSSSCAYPKLAPQPMKEECLLAGPPEETNGAYSIAKIAGISMCQSYHKQYGCNFISSMPTNIYGPGDNFDKESSHVIPALIRKFQEAKEAGAPQVSLWGTGQTKREFLHVDDLAEASLFLMEHYNDSEIINVGTGSDITIKELAEKIQTLTGYQGEVLWDSSKPDGSPRKLVDVTKIHNAGWHHRIEFDDGLKETYHWYLEHRDAMN